jgi:hypothetical protein
MVDDVLEDVRRLVGPVELPSAQRTAQLRSELLFSIQSSSSERSRRHGLRPLGARRRRAAGITAVAAVLLALLGYGLSSSASPRLRPFSTPWAASKPLPVELATLPGSSSQSWRLVSYLIGRSWQQNLHGPAPGYLTCASASTCFVVGDTSNSPSGPADYGSLYVTTDFGMSWSVLPLPKQTTVSSPLACSDDLHCFAGALVEGDPAFLETQDGGHSWTVRPLPSGMPPLAWLQCASDATCHGLAVRGRVAPASPYPTGDELFVSTVNGGLGWHTVAFPPHDAISAVTCRGWSFCVAVGWNSTTSVVSGEALVTVDGGARWSPGALPYGFGFDAFSNVSCGSTRFCMAHRRFRPDFDG